MERSVGAESTTGVAAGGEPVVNLSHTAVARVKVTPGRHSIFLDARGYSRRQEIDVPKGGWAVVSLMALH